MFALLTWQVAAHGALRTLDERCGLALSGSAVPAPVAQFFADLGSTTVALPVLLAAVAGTLWRSVRASRHAWGAERGGGTGPHGARGRVESPCRSPRGGETPVDGPEAGRAGYVGSVRCASGWPGPVRVRRWLPSLAALCTMVLVPAVVVPAKVWIGRPGPPRMAGAHPDGFYPSGHAATAAVAYGLVALLLLHGRRRSGRTVRGRGAAALSVSVVLVNVGVGVGLVRQGYHWPMDVVASWCLSGVLLTLWSAVCARWYGAGSTGGSDPHRASCAAPV
ncbi:phosphatase PAP2 family protein [Streptomyces sp. NBC_01525]